MSLTGFGKSFLPGWASCVVTDSERAQLGEVTQLTMGQSPKGASYNTLGAGVPLLNGPTEFGRVHPVATQWTTEAAKTCQEGDLLFCVRGSTTGRMNWADQTYCLGRGVAAIRGADQVDTHFAYYSLVNALPRLLGLSAGSVFPNLSKKDLETFSIWWPTRDQRELVASTLHAYDDLIESNRAVARALEQAATTYLRARCITFELEDDLQQTELGLTPRGWPVLPLGDVALVRRDTCELDELNADEPYIGLDAMPRGSTILDEWGRRHDVTGQTSRFARGEILFGKLRPYFKKVGVAPVDGSSSTEIIVLRPKTAEHFATVLGHVASQEFIDFCDGISTGTRMPRAEWSAASKYRIAVPPDEIAAEISAVINPLYSMIGELTVENSTLVNIRDSVLAELMPSHFVSDHEMSQR
jgi:type I restriction enzyme S subunit